MILQGEEFLISSDPQRFLLRGTRYVILHGPLTAEQRHSILPAVVPGPALARVVFGKFSGFQTWQPSRLAIRGPGRPLA